MVGHIGSNACNHGHLNAFVGAARVAALERELSDARAEADRLRAQVRAAANMKPFYAAMGFYMRLQDHRLACMHHRLASEVPHWQSWHA